MSHFQSANPSVSEAFRVFFHDWPNHQTHLFEQLLAANALTTEQQRTLIEQVMSHYTRYYEEKSRAANENVFLFFSPPWFTTFERSLMWLGGFKPSIIFSLLNGSIRDLTEEQRGRIEQVKPSTRREERELSETMARIQESVTSPPFMNLARGVERLVDGQVSEIEIAMEQMKSAMLAVLEKADSLRTITAMNVVEVLSPSQTIRFLAAVAEFHLKARRWGQQRDLQRAAISYGQQ